MLDKIKIRKCSLIDLNVTRLEIQGPFKLKNRADDPLFFSPVVRRTSQQFTNDARTKIIRCSAGVHGFRHDGEGEEEEEDEQGCGRDKLEERGERWETIEGEGEDVTQAVLGLSVRWIWHLEEQRPLTLRCGRAAACVARLVHTRATCER